MARFALAIAALPVLLLLLVESQLVRLEAAGPLHRDLVLDGGVPATLYLPGTLREFGPPPPAEERPPALVLGHGFSMDRAAMSVLARRVAANGIAVLTIDFDGHGESPRPFEDGRSDSRFAELDAALRYLRQSPEVDGFRLAVAGHSMGASAALDYASRDPALAATVLVSGGRLIDGPYRPSNALLIWAEGDPAATRDRLVRLAAVLADVPEIEMGRRYGEFDGSSALRAVEVPGVDHVSIVFSAAATREIIEWLRLAFGMDPTAPMVLEEPRLRWLGFAGLLFALSLPGIGWAIGRLAPPSTPLSGPHPALGLVLLAAILLGTLPLLGVHSPGSFLGIEIGGRLVVQLALAGGVLLAVLAALGSLRDRRLGRELLQALPVGALGFAVVYALLLPLGPVLHRFALDPQRARLALVLTLLVLPFGLAFHLLLRRGRWPVDLAFGLAGRAVVLGVLLLGISIGVLRSVILLILPTIVLLYLLFEVLATAIHARSRNAALVAWVESAWYAATLAAVVPLLP